MPPAKHSVKFKFTLLILLDYSNSSLGAQNVRNLTHILNWGGFLKTVIADVMFMVALSAQQPLPNPASNGGFPKVSHCYNS